MLEAAALPNMESAAWKAEREILRKDGDNKYQSQIDYPQEHLDDVFRHISKMTDLSAEAFVLSLRMIMMSKIVLANDVIVKKGRLR